MRASSTGYVLGGCGADDSADWGEDFDPKTQTREPLPDLGAKLRFSSIRQIQVVQGKLHVISNEQNDSLYYPKEGKWDVAEKIFVQCVIDNVWYLCDIQSCLWYDTNRNEWREVRGLDMLNRNLRYGTTEIDNYGGKLLILWDDKFVHHDPDKNI